MTDHPRYAAQPELVNEFLRGSTPKATAWTLAVFAIYAAILLTLCNLMHRVGLRALIGPLKPAWRQFLRISIYLIPIYALLLVLALETPYLFQSMGFGHWAALLPLSLSLVLLQIGTEELVFRGYLQSHLAALTGSAAVYIIVPSILFGLIHYNGDVPAYSAWAYVGWATCFGIVCADLTARAGTLGPAFAVHFINNVGAILVLSPDDRLYGLALYVWPTFGQPWEPWIPFEALFLFTVWLTARLALRR